MSKAYIVLRAGSRTNPNDFPVVAEYGHFLDAFESGVKVVEWSTPLDGESIEEYQDRLNGRIL